MRTGLVEEEALARTKRGALVRSLFLEQMTTYASYHRSRWNRRLHHVGVPAITLALLLALATVSFGRVGPYAVSLATVFAVGVMVYWVVLDLRIGLLTLLAYLPLVLLAAWLAEHDRRTVGTLFASLFFGGWVFQLVGHSIEGRRPALLDNLAQALIAPVFLTAELWFAAGRFPGLEAALQERRKSAGRD